MSPREAEIADFLARHDAVMRVEVSAVRGSAPREAGAFMLVSAKGAYGTIGGGALEFQMIGEARRYLRSGKETAILSIPLGPGHRAMLRRPCRDRVRPFERCARRDTAW